MKKLKEKEAKAETAEEKQAIDDEANDGEFWMKWEDFCAEFENLTVCHLDDHHDIEKRLKGLFSD